MLAGAHAELLQAIEEKADREDAASGDEGAESEVGGAGRRPLSAPPGPKGRETGVRGKRNRLAELGLARPRAGGVRGKPTWLAELGLARPRARPARESRGGQEAGGGRSAFSEKSSLRASTRLGTKNGRSWR